MRKKIKHILALLCIFLFVAQADASNLLLIPMDRSQSNHLKAYGIAYDALEKGTNVEWLLNYRGGSFSMEYSDHFEKECLLRGVSYERISSGQYASIMNVIEENNMSVVLLEKAPKIAVYTPPNTMPWDDAVTLALSYAEINYDKVYDTEILRGELNTFDWLHLHHEDFTGQYGKFYGNYRNAAWYIQEQLTQEKLAASLGFSKVSELKLAVAQEISNYVLKGGFIFAMCAATDTYDIALGAHATDICHAVFDHDGIDPDFNEKLDYSQTFAFTD
ncbi:MAG: asparagine synthetase B, partial [FCB group bacterium]|nr:asparagine synthetase B [FCB group bacterium]